MSFILSFPKLYTSSKPAETWESHLYECTIAAPILSLWSSFTTNSLLGFHGVLSDSSLGSRTILAYLCVWNNHASAYYGSSGSVLYDLMIISAVLY